MGSTLKDYKESADIRNFRVRSGRFAAAATLFDITVGGISISGRMTNPLRSHRLSTKTGLFQ
jgi:hypothetical protein